MAIQQAILAVTVSPITDTDWERITSQHGTTFVSLMAVIVLWGALVGFIYRTGKREETRRLEEIAREEKRRVEELETRRLDDEARERRHLEMMQVQSRNADDLKALTAEAIKAQLYGGHASETLAKNIQHLIVQLGERPCQLPKQ